MEKILLQCQNISKTYPGVKALKDISFFLNYGEIHALIGENGAGKSTLIKILAGIEQPDDGAKIFMEGTQIQEITPIISIKKGISVIYQDLSLLKNLSVGENLFLGRLLEKNHFWVNWKKLRQIALNTLAEVSLDVEPNTLVESLAIGKQQIVAIAKALTIETKIFIMDEPTSSLSASEIEDLFRVMQKIKNKGISIIFVSHKLDELFRICDRFTILRDGSYMGTFNKTELTESQLIKLMVGRDIEYFIHPKRDKQAEKTVLKIEHFSKKKHFGDISFELHHGEILGFYGMVGAGRTELMQAIFGIEKPDTGILSINGVPINILSTVKARKVGLSYIPEDRLNEGLFISRNIHDNLIITSKSINTLQWRNLIQEKELVSEQIDSLNVIPRIPNMLADQLSGGNKQKVVIGKWIAINPMIMIVDEPTNGIDIGAKVEMHNLLRRLSEQGVSIIVISSEMNEIISVCDRLIVMRRGRISATLYQDEIKPRNIMKYAAIGLHNLRDSK